MLKEYLHPQRILFDFAAATMEEAVRRCGQLLVAGGCAGPGYPDAMVQTVRKWGDSVVMVPRIAFPHAAFTAGGLRPGIAVIHLSTPLDFGGENGPVQYLFGFCGKNAESHMQVLSALAEFFSSPENGTRLAQAKDASALYQLLGQ